MSEIVVIKEHPIPLSEEDAEELQAVNPMFQDRDDVLHPDELHERYKDVLGENNEWCVFRSGLYPHSGYVFAWNKQLGYGLRIHDEEGSFRNFVQVMMRAAEAVA